MTTAADLIASFGLQPHPEGGHYREVFRAKDLVMTANGPRSAGTTIFYLLSGNERSHFHRIDADEIWFYHQGGPLDIYSLNPDGSGAIQTLSEGNPQVIIPKGVWFGAKLKDMSGYCLASCAVMPGFEFSGFEMAKPNDLLRDWPDYESWIDVLTAQS